MNYKENPPIIILYASIFFSLIFFAVPMFSNVNINTKITSVQIGMVGGIIGVIVWMLVQLSRVSK
jgi:hypothetical protein